MSITLPLILLVPNAMGTLPVDNRDTFYKFYTKYYYNWL